MNMPVVLIAWRLSQESTGLKTRLRRRGLTTATAIDAVVSTHRDQDHVNAAMPFWIILDRSRTCGSTSMKVARMNQGPCPKNVRRLPRHRGQKWLLTSFCVWFPSRRRLTAKAEGKNIRIVEDNRVCPY